MGGALGTPTRPLPCASGILKSCARAVPVGGRSVGRREAPGIHTHSVLVSRAQGGPSQGLGQRGLVLGDERELGARAAGHERYPPGVRGERWQGLEGKRAWGRVQGRLAAPQPSSQKLRCTQRARRMQPLQHRVRSLSSALWLFPVDSLEATAWWEPGAGDPGGAWPAPFVPEPSSPCMLRAAENSRAPSSSCPRGTLA